MYHGQLTPENRADERCSQHRGKTRFRELVKLGVPWGMAGLGAVGTSPWRMAASPVLNMALSNTYWRKQGLVSLAERYRPLRGA